MAQKAITFSRENFRILFLSFDIKALRSFYIKVVHLMGQWIMSVDKGCDAL